MAWDKMPKGWTEDSLKSWWDSMVGDVKHPVTKCIDKMQDKMDDPGAFCASAADKVDPGWRIRKAGMKLPAAIRSKVNQAMAARYRNQYADTPSQAVRVLREILLHAGLDYQGMVHGHDLIGGDGRIRLDLEYQGEPIESMLIMSWHDMLDTDPYLLRHDPDSKYEIVAYLS